MTEQYRGRLAFDPETNFHTDNEGRQVVTPDGGQTWYYAEDGDPSHFERYHKRFAEVDTTANAVLGMDPSEAREAHPHHFEVQPDDPHYDGSQQNKTALLYDPDVEAAKITSHTEAYAE